MAAHAVELPRKATLRWRNMPSRISSHVQGIEVWAGRLIDRTRPAILNRLDTEMIYLACLLRSSAMVWVMSNVLHRRHEPDV